MMWFYELAGAIRDEMVNFADGHQQALFPSKAGAGYVMIVPLCEDANLRFCGGLSNLKDSQSGCVEHSISFAIISGGQTIATSNDGELRYYVVEAHAKAAACRRAFETGGPMFSEEEDERRLKKGLATLGGGVCFEIGVDGEAYCRIISAVSGAPWVTDDRACACIATLAAIKDWFSKNFADNEVVIIAPPYFRRKIEL